MILAKKTKASYILGSQMFFESDVYGLPILISHVQDILLRLKCCKNKSAEIILCNVKN